MHDLRKRSRFDFFKLIFKLAKSIAEAERRWSGDFRIEKMVAK